MTIYQLEERTKCSVCEEEFPDEVYHHIMNGQFNVKEGVHLIDDQVYCTKCYADLKGFAVRECYTCDELVVMDPELEGETYCFQDIYHTPWDDKSVEIVLHINNDPGGRGYGDCQDLLQDTSWADFRYFYCECCNRMICEQNPSNGWHTQYRIHEDEQICLKCYEEIILENGCSKESYENKQIEGMFLDPGDAEKAGFEQVDGYIGFYIRGKEDSKVYCEKALALIADGYIVLNKYDRMAIGGLEGYVTMWVKRKP